jgi:hypothetical protein
MNIDECCERIMSAALGMMRENAAVKKGINTRTYSQPSSRDRDLRIA